MKAPIKPPRGDFKNNECLFNDQIARCFGAPGLTHYLCEITKGGFKIEFWTFHNKGKGYASLILDHEYDTWTLEEVDPRNKCVRALRRAQTLISENQITTNDQLIEASRKKILPEAKEQATRIIQSAQTEAARITAEANRHVVADPYLISEVRRNTIATYPADLSPMERLQNICELFGGCVQAIGQILRGDKITAVVTKTQDIAIHRVRPDEPAQHVLTVRLGPKEEVSATPGEDVIVGKLPDGLRHEPVANIIHGTLPAPARGTRSGVIDLQIPRATSGVDAMQLTRGA